MCSAALPSPPGVTYEQLFVPEEERWPRRRVFQSNPTSDPRRTSRRGLDLETSRVQSRSRSRHTNGRHRSRPVTGS